MGIWDILGIEQTKDKNKIKEAYYEKLNYVHPEENPEGFKELRRAFEEAMRISEEVEDKNEFSEIELWMEKVKKVYNNFALRLNEEAWKNLFQEDVCYGLDTREEALIALLRFFMDKYYLSKNIWQLIDNTFHIKERKRELMEIFPINFIEFVIDRIDYDDALNYNLFKIEEGKDYDRCIYLYKDILGKLHTENIEELWKKFHELKALNIENPYITSLEGRLLIYSDKLQEAEDLVIDIAEKYPKEIEITLVMAEILYKEGKFEEALRYCERNLEIVPEDYSSLLGKADTLGKLQRFAEAKEYYEKIEKIHGTNDYIMEKLRDVNTALIKEYEKRFEENKEDYETAIKLGRCLYENNYLDKAEKLLNSINIDSSNKEYEKYLDLAGKIYFAMKRYDSAYKNYDVLEKIAINDEDNEKKLSYVYRIKGQILVQLNELERALEYYKKAMNLAGEDIDILNVIARTLYLQGKYDESLKVSDRSIELEDYQLVAYVNRAKAYMKLGFDREALDDTNRLLGIYPGYIEAFIIKLDIYEKYSDYESMENILKQLEEKEIEDDRLLVYNLKVLIGKKQYNEVINRGHKYLEKIKDRDNVEKIIADINYEMAIAYNNNGIYETSEKYIDNAIKLNATKYEYMYFKAFVYQNMKRFDKAIKIYNDMSLIAEETMYALRCKGELLRRLKHYTNAIDVYREIKRMDPENKFVNGYIYEIYKEQGYIEQALKYLDMQLHIMPSAYYYIEKGNLLVKNSLEEARECYKKALELEEDNGAALNNIGLTYEEKGEYEEAIKYYKRALYRDTDYNNPDYVEKISRCYEALGKEQEAIEVIKDNLKNYHNISLYYKLARLLSKRGSYEEAIEFYYRTIKEGELNKDSQCRCYMFIGEALELLGKYEESLDAYCNALKAYDRNRIIRKRIANVYAYLGNFESAIKFMKDQKSVMGRDTDWKINLGELLKDAGKNIMATICIRNVLGIYRMGDENNPYTSMKIGYCYYVLGNIKKAKEYLYNSISAFEASLDPSASKNSFEAYFILGKTLEMAGEYEDALRYFETANELKGEEDVDVVKAIRKLKKKIK